MKVLVKTHNEHLSVDHRKLIEYVFSDVKDGTCDLSFSLGDPSYPTDGFQLILDFEEHYEPSKDIGRTVWGKHGSRRLVLESMHWYTLIAQRSLNLKTQVEYAISHPPANSKYLSDVSICKTCPHGVYDTFWALDIETTGFDFKEDEIICVAFHNGIDTYVVEPDDPNLRSFLLENRFVMQNGKFDTLFLYHKFGFWPKLVDDTMFMHYCVDESSGTQGLKYLATTFLGWHDYESDLKAHMPKGSKSYGDIPRNVLDHYAALDVVATFQLWEMFVDISTSQAYRFMMNAQPYIRNIEYNGMHVDQDLLQQQKEELSDEKDLLLANLQEEKTDLNPNSPKQLAALLYDEWGMSFIPVKKEKPRSCAASIISRLQSKYPDKEQFFDDLQDFKSVGKLLSTYVIGLEDKVGTDGRIRSSYLMHGTVTGRLSSRGPNMQNVPRPTKNAYTAEIRNIFCAPEGKTLVGADYSQAELRVAATLAHAESMKAVWDVDGDLHTATCEDIFGEVTPEKRTIAKVINFSVLYGLSAQSLSEDLKIPVSDAQQYIDKFFESKPRLHNWLQNTRNAAARFRTLTSRNGRTRHFGEVFGTTSMDQTANQAGNFEVQSLASDICIQAVVDISKALEQLNLGVVVATVHDSIYVECEDQPLIINRVKSIVETCMVLAAPKILGEKYVPFNVDLHVDPKWGNH